MSVKERKDYTLRVVSGSSLHHLRGAGAVVEQLDGAQLEDLVQEGGRLVDVNRHGSVAGWIPHRLVKVLQPGERANRHTHYLGPIMGLWGFLFWETLPLWATHIMVLIIYDMPDNRILISTSSIRDWIASRLINTVPETRYESVLLLEIRHLGWRDLLVTDPRSTQPLCQ